VKITVSKENYLKTIAEAESEGETVKASTLSRWLSVSPPAVTMAVRRLRRDTLIDVAAEGQITLTPSGREIADRLLNRHHLIERMLGEIFGMEWYKVHEEAEQLEHAVSADFERKLIESAEKSVLYCAVITPSLAEAVALSLVGGLTGIALGAGVSEAITTSLGWPVLITGSSILIAFAFSAAVGIFFGWYPARKAASLDPIEALRYE